MSAQEVIARAQSLARDMGIETDDLEDELPERQVALIRDRIARRVLVLREELHGLSGPPQRDRLAA